jgi:sorbitol-specific phosphotransferase system component IIBC
MKPEAITAVSVEGSLLGCDRLLQLYFDVGDGYYIASKLHGVIFQKGANTVDGSNKMMIMTTTTMMMMMMMISYSPVQPVLSSLSPSKNVKTGMHTIIISSCCFIWV